MCRGARTTTCPASSRAAGAVSGKARGEAPRAGCRPGSPVSQCSTTSCSQGAPEAQSQGWLSQEPLRVEDFGDLRESIFFGDFGLPPVPLHVEDVEVGMLDGPALGSSWGTAGMKSVGFSLLEQLMVGRKALGRPAQVEEPQAAAAVSERSRESAVRKEAQPKTTVMLRNVPREITKALLLDELRLAGGMDGAVDFLHVCVDFKDKACTGDAYINFLDPSKAREFVYDWQGRSEMCGFACSRGRKRTQLNVAFARKQGFDLCVIENYRKHIKDVRLKAWVPPDRDARRRDLERAKDARLPAEARPATPPGLGRPPPPPPGLEVFAPTVTSPRRLALQAGGPLAIFRSH